MQERFIAAVDLGSSKISLSVSKVESGCTEVQYYRELPSEGTLRGNIFNPKKACGPLRTLINDAEESLGIKICQVAVAFPRWNVKAESVEFSTDRSNADEFITEDEVSNLKDLAISNCLNNLEPDTLVYGAVAQSFSTEDLFQVSEDDVVGVTSKTLQGRFLVFTGPKKPVSNISKVMNELNIAITRECFVPVLESECVLTNDEKEHGVALVELGGGITSVAIFHRGVMRSYGAFPFGGKTITSDIHLECGIQDSLAENIKLGFGSCMPDRLQSLSEKIIQINDLRTGESQQLPVKYLSEIIGSRMHEIAEAVMHIIAESGYADSLRGGIVLTGGGAELLSCSALFSDMSGFNSRVAYPHGNGVLTEGCPEITSLAAAAQLSMIAALRGDDHINCGEAACADSPEPKPEVKEEEDTQEANGTLFGNEETEPQAKPEPRKTERKQEKPKKPKRQWFGAINDFVGSLYENVGSNEEEEK